MEQKFSRYAVIRNVRLDEVINTVNIWLEQGWYLVGGISCDAHGAYIQAVAL